MVVGTRISRSLREFGRATRCGAAACAMLAFASCAPAPRATKPLVVAPATVSAPFAGTAAQTARYAVDPARSEIRILTFRAGPLARLGHSHVLISRDLRGSIVAPDDDAATKFDLELPVESLAIDEPEARAAEGAEFASVPTADDVAGTRRNLLGPQVLDAATYPTLRVTGAGASADGDGHVVHARIELRGQSTPIDVRSHVVRDATGLVATGEFRVTQSALGLAPFSVAFGALQVRDEIVVRFRVAAVRAAT